MGVVIQGLKGEDKYASCTSVWISKASRKLLCETSPGAGGGGGGGLSSQDIASRRLSWFLFCVECLSMCDSRSTPSKSSTRSPRKARMLETGPTLY